MIVEAVRFAGQSIAELIAHAPADDPCAVVTAFTAFWKQMLLDSDYRAGCPVLALAVDHSDDNDRATLVVREVFAQWRTILSDRLRATGIDDARADTLATVAIAAAEGAVVLCRVQRSSQPLDDISAGLCALLSDA